MAAGPPGSNHRCASPPRRRPMARPGSAIGAGQAVRVAVCRSSAPVHRHIAGRARRTGSRGCAIASSAARCRLLHAQPAHAWTVDELARKVGLSRSALAQRFSDFLGSRPCNTWPGGACRSPRSNCVTVTSRLPTSRNTWAMIRRRHSIAPSNVNSACLRQAGEEPW